jgi:hypothetical protein
MVFVSSNSSIFYASSRLEFCCTNNQANIKGNPTIHIGVKQVEAFSDSLLITQQVYKGCLYGHPESFWTSASEPSMNAYVDIST